MNTLRIGTEVYEDADDLDVQELRELKRVTGLTVTAFWAAVRESDPDAVAALVWVLRRRADGNLRLSDVHFRYSDITFDAGDSEDEPGKAQTSTTPTPSDGSDSSPSTADIPASSTTA